MQEGENSRHLNFIKRLPAAPLRETLPQGICEHHSFDQLLPKHSFGDDAMPFLADEFGRTKRARVQERKDVFRHVIETLS